MLRPGGTLVIVDKNACSWNARRPWLPSVAVKWIDERRGLWMYSHRDKVRERWFRAGGAASGGSCGGFASVHVEYLLSRAERGRFPFQHLPGTRLFVLVGGAGRREATRDGTLFADRSRRCRFSCGRRRRAWS